MAKTVLIVDDAGFVRKTLTNILSSAHYQIVGEAKDGFDAVQLYMKLRPDLTFMDIVMPNLSGIQSLGNIMQKDKEAKVIMVSAMNQEHIIMEAIHAGAKDYILKPFSSDEILRSAEHVITGGQEAKVS